MRGIHSWKFINVQYQVSKWFLKINVTDYNWNEQGDLRDIHVDWKRSISFQSILQYYTLYKSFIIYTILVKAEAIILCAHNSSL